MKNALIVLGLAIGLASCGETTQSENDTTSGLKIAYYVKDSLTNNLDFSKAAQKDLEIMSESYSLKGAALQKEYQRLGELYTSKKNQGLLSADAEGYYMGQLEKLQGQMASLEQGEGANLQSKIATLEQQLVDMLDKYGKEYADENGINLFLSKGPIGTIVHADSTMDVTMDFIEFMNKQDDDSSDS